MENTTTHESDFDKIRNAFLAEKKQLLETHFESLFIKLVKLHHVHPPEGKGFFRTSDLDPSATYEVLATFIHHYSDGGEIRCFMLWGPGGHIIERVVTNFAVSTMC